MRAVPLATLQDRIVRPGFEKHLLPLLAYRGAVTLGMAHRMWNLVVSGMEHEATMADLTQRLQHNPDFSQLCVPEKVKNSLAFRGFLSRLKLSPKVMGEMPHLQEYVWWVDPHQPFGLTPVSPTSHRRRSLGAGGWRTFKDGRSNPRPATREKVVFEYPFLIHDGGKPEHDLLKRVNSAVSRTFKPHMRADICQDIIVGILSGDFSVDDLALPVKEMTRKVFAMSMEKYGDLSLDAPVPGGTTPFVELLSNEDSIWERI